MFHPAKQPVTAAVRRSDPPGPIGREDGSRGFTLVELLVVISIITLLAATVLVALAGVQETARVDRTRAQVARIDTLIGDRWEQFKSRRIRTPQAPTPQLASYFGGMALSYMNQNQMAWMARYQVDAIREQMRMELPDRKTDLLELNQVPHTTPPALWWAYRNKARKLLMQKRKVTLPPVKDPSFRNQLDNLWSPDFDNAECLYLILSQINERDRSALEFFPAKEIGDVDGDGMPEILDSWGRPIVFARWAPGLEIAGGPQDRRAPDPFDLRGIYPQLNRVKTYALYPLISSAGPDQRQEIFLDNLDVKDRVNYALSSPPNNPYLAVAPVYMQQVKVMLGSFMDSNGDHINGSLDNITNHNLTGS